MSSPSPIPTTLAPHLAASSRRRVVASAVLIPAALTALALLMALTSRGFFEPDEIAHFLFARAATRDWTQITNIWARLFTTALAAPLTPLGITGPRLLAVALTVLTAHLTARLARHYLPQILSPFLRRHSAAAIWLLLVAQPCFFLNSFTVMTEMPLALCWTAASLALLNRRLNLAGILLGLAATTRPEAWLALLAFPPFLLYLLTRHQDFFAVAPPRPFADSTLPIPPVPSPLRRIAAPTLLSSLPPLLWLTLWAIANLHSLQRVGTFPWTSNPYHPPLYLFPLAATAALALWLWPPVILGTLSLLKKHAPQFAASPCPRVAASVPLAPSIPLLLLPTAAFFSFHALAASFGLFGSLALPRYFIAIAPQFAILAFLGLAQLEPRAPRLLRTTTLTLALAPIIILAILGYIPLRPDVEQQRLDIAAQALRARSPDEAHIIVGHPYLLLTLNLDPDSPAHKALFFNNVPTAPPGTCLIADTTTWYFENRPSPDQLQQWGYVQDPASAQKIDALPESFEPLTLKSPNAQNARVRLWIKQN